MNKKMRIIVIVFLLVILCALMCVVGVLLLNKKNQRLQEEKYQQEFLFQQEQMKISLDEIERINMESDFHGYHLLDAPPEGYCASVENYLELSESLCSDTYSCSLYNGANCITHISLETVGANLYGIEVGDDAIEGESLLEEKSYSLDELTTNVKTFSKGNITITLYTTEEGVIKEIAVAVVDPMVEQIDY